ncbi:MAG TPA: hypothetical protein VM713_00990 [Steroidobacteraceae bacterium]|nr:hypothetical protein [Steroidobacteraceae bacterium]
MTAAGGAEHAPGRRRMIAGLLAFGACGMSEAAAPGSTAARAAMAAAASPLPQASIALDAFFDDLEKRTFDFFWETTNPANGLVPDRFPCVSE